MIKSKFLSLLISPISFLYGCVVVSRNFLFTIGILPVYKSKFATTISVGNLSVGGTGKTPHVEYLVKLLNSYKLATLSRGYGRNTKGFIEANNEATALSIGDEPMQYFNKFKNIKVTVSEKRKKGIVELEKQQTPPDVIILDDAFQHRYVKPSLSILLTEYTKPFYADYLLPSGCLREPKMGYKRADIIIVTKCPTKLNPTEKQNIILRVNPQPYQQVFFSHIKYGAPIALTSSAKAIESCEDVKDIVLLTAIANPTPLYDYLLPNKEITHVKFPDHHLFSSKDIELVTNTFHNLPSENKVIFTTEKDSMRLDITNDVIATLPIFYIPIEIDFPEQDRNTFNDKILSFVSNNQKHISFHSLY